MKHKILFIFLLAVAALAPFSCKRLTNQAEITAAPDLRGTGITLPGVTAIAFSEDGAFFAAGTGEGSLFIWDINRGRRIREIRAGGNAVTAASFSPEGKYALAQMSAGETLAWDFFKGEAGDAAAVLVSAALAGAMPPVSGLRYSQRGSSLEVTLENGQTVNISLTEKTEKITAAAANLSATRLLTGSDSGAIRLWNLQTGEEIVRYISFGIARNDAEDEPSEWISLLPNGYYNASAKGAALMKVESGGKTYAMSEFANALFRPDLQSIAVKEGSASYAEDTLKSLLSPENAPPLVEIIGSKSVNVTEGSAQVRVKITASGGGVGRMKVVNGGDLAGYMAVSGIAQKQYLERGKQVYEAAFTVPLKPGKNTVGVSVFGEKRKRESKTVYVDITTSWEGEKADKPDLHALLMSVATYKNAGRGGISNLRYTGADADALGELFMEQEKGSLYKKVHIHRYADEQITKEGFQKAFSDAAAKAGRNDSFVFFFAGHGFVDKPSGDFFFIPYDSAGFLDNSMENNIVMDDIIGGITSVNAKNSLMLLDTCQSGTLLESGDTAFERLIQQLNQKAIITATMGNEEAWESMSIGHGIFTASILDSYLHNPQRQFSTAADMIAFTKEDVPNKFAKIIKASGARALTVIETNPVNQRPMSHMPREDFDVFDKYTEPGVVEVRSVTAGTVSVFGLPGETVAIRANGAVEKRLAGGTYSVSVEYADKHIETKQVTVSAAPKAAKARKETVVFDYKPAPAVVVPPMAAEKPAAVAQTAAAAVAVVEEPVPAAQPAAIERLTPTEMVRIQGGTFTMGSPANERGRSDDEGPQHQVTVSSFNMGKYQVTQKEYQEVMGSNPSYFKGDNLPVEQVSWYDAVEYCNKRSQKEGLTPAYIISGSGDSRTVTLNRSANGYRLPTEAEWEYACRAGTTTAYNTGASISYNTGWYSSNSGDKTHPVGQKPANAWGLYDMHGNVGEWCWDWYGNYASGAQTDPVGAISGSARVLRGGSWYGYGRNLRSAYRGHGTPSYWYYGIGFRLVRP